MRKSIRGYDQYISDNLDSWCSALTFDMIGSCTGPSSVVKHAQKQVRLESSIAKAVLKLPIRGGYVVRE